MIVEKNHITLANCFNISKITNQTDDQYENIRKVAYDIFYGDISIVLNKVRENGWMYVNLNMDIFEDVCGPLIVWNWLIVAENRDGDKGI